MPATGRHLLVNDAGVMNTLDLGAVAKAACPQWKTVAAPMYAPALISALRVVYDAPLVGPQLVPQLHFLGAQRLLLGVHQKHI